MSRPAPVHRNRLLFACSAVLFALSLIAYPRPGEAREAFQGYSEEVRAQAARVVAEAGPGREQSLAREVGVLWKKMLARGILSINEIPDHIYERAVKERWKKHADRSIRAVAPVSALSVPMWAWLIKSDIQRLDLASMIEDARSLAATIRWFGPALMGYVAWMISYLSAAACWFVVWVSLLLFLRARPSFEYDIYRAVGFLPRPEYAAPVIAFLLFILPMVLGAGLAVTACIWLVASTAYMRRTELVLVVGALLLLGGVIIAGGAVDSLTDMAGDVGTSRWLAGEGYAAAPTSRPASGKGAVTVKISRPSGDVQGIDPWMLRFSMGRMETQAGRPKEAERIWTDLVAEGKDLPEVLNNRGIALVQQGRTREALADFQAAIEKRPNDGPALWNAYQVHLQSFSLELASTIQPQAWEMVGRMAPFRFKPAEMDQGEWIASVLPVREIWKGYMERPEDWMREAKNSDFFEWFFRPFDMKSALTYLCLSLLAVGIIKLLTIKYWLSCTCRACGGHILIAGSKEAADLCTPCRGQIGEGVRGGEERERRLQTISLHAKYVRACSVVAPGSGALWAGKDFRTVAYGIWLSLALGAVTVCLGGARTGEGLITSLQVLFLWIAGSLSAMLWLAGIVWGAWSFGMLQQRSNLPMPKR